MEKLQILFPLPVLNKLRKISSYEDRPISELVRKAIDRMLEQYENIPAQKRELKKFPSVKGNKIKVSSEELKDLIYD